MPVGSEAFGKTKAKREKIIRYKESERLLLAHSTLICNRTFFLHFFEDILKKVY